MTPRHPLLFTRLLLLLPLLWNVACGQEEPRFPPASTPVVVTSIFPVGDLTERLAGQAARVEVLLPPGASPATFEVTPRQLRDLSGAQLFIMVGGGMDEWVASLPEAAGGMASVVRLTEGIPLMHAREGEEASGNPHIWLDPVLVRDQVLPRLRDAVAGVAPDSARVIAQRAEVLADSLTALHQQIQGILEPLDRRSYVATHPAWTYYAARYDLREVGVVHSHPGEEPSSREMAGLLETAREHQVHCVFTEPQLGDVAARALATELSLPTCMVDPLGGPGQEGREGYFQLLRFNTRQFAQGLQREPS
jgi:zinc transport system substrate-binding protein